MTSPVKRVKGDRLINNVGMSVSDFLEYRPEGLLADLLADPTIADELLDAAGLRSKREYRRNLVRALWPYVINYRKDLLNRLLEQTVQGGTIHENGTYVLERGVLCARDGNKKILAIVDQHIFRALGICARDSIEEQSRKITQSVIRWAMNSSLRPGMGQEFAQFLEDVEGCFLPFKQAIRENGFSLLISCMKGEVSRGDGTAMGEDKVVDALLAHGASLGEKFQDPGLMFNNDLLSLGKFVVKERTEGNWAGDLFGQLLDRGLDWREIYADPGLSQGERDTMEQQPHIKRILLGEQLGHERICHNTVELPPKL